MQCMTLYPTMETYTCGGKVCSTCPLHQKEPQTLVHILNCCTATRDLCRYEGHGGVLSHGSGTFSFNIWIPWPNTVCKTKISKLNFLMQQPLGIRERYLGLYKNKQLRPGYKWYRICSLPFWSLPKLPLRTLRIILILYSGNTTFREVASCVMKDMLQHVLNHCPVVLQSCHYNKWHDIVLSVMCCFLTKMIVAC